MEVEGCDEQRVCHVVCEAKCQETNELCQEILRCTPEASVSQLVNHDVGWC